MAKKYSLLNRSLILGIIILFICVGCVSSIEYNIKCYNSSGFINKINSPTVLLYENFSGIFPPIGWETDFWTQCNESCMTDPPCACLYSENLNGSNNSYITTKAFNTSSYEIVYLSFVFGVIGEYPNYFSFYIRFRINDTSPWLDITPWDNPINEDMWPEFYCIEINLSSGNFGDALQINCTFQGNYYYFHKSCLDDISIWIPGDPPDAPIIKGPNTGMIGVEYTYTFNTTFDEEYSFVYQVNWGDGSPFELVFPDYTNPETSGEGKANHSWSEKGTYIIQARVYDFYDGLGPWADLHMKIPRTRATINSWFHRLFEHFPLLERLLLFVR